jgi:hypothetical protein
VPSEEIRATVAQDAELAALIERVQVEGPDQAFMVVQAIASGDDSEVIAALGLSPEEADRLARDLYAKAREYAERFPELHDAAAFFGSAAESSD